MEGNETINGEAGRAENRRLLIAIYDKFSRWPWYKQVIAMLLFMAACAISFQMIHGFNVLCDYSTKMSGGVVKLCFATEPQKWDTTGFQKRRVDQDAFRDSALKVLGKLDVLPGKVDDLLRRVGNVETVVNLLASETGTSDKIDRELHPKKPKNLFDQNAKNNPQVFNPSGAIAVNPKGSLAFNSANRVQDSIDRANYIPHWEKETQ